MGTITKGYTYGATEQVTNENLHTLVDSASVTDIRNTDIAAGAGINESKISFDGATVCTLADTQTVSGAKTFSGTTTFTGTVDMSSATLTSLVNFFLPVGSIYANYAVSTNPATLFGVGTWVAIEEQVIAGYKAGSAEFGAIGTYAGGEKTHTLSEAEMPAHDHNLLNSASYSVDDTPANNPVNRLIGDPGTSTVQTGAGIESVTYLSTVGSGSAHNNIQPTYVAYLWRRTE